MAPMFSIGGKWSRNGLKWTGRLRFRRPSSAKFWICPGTTTGTAFGTTTGTWLTTFMGNSVGWIISGLNFCLKIENKNYGFKIEKKNSILNEIIYLGLSCCGICRFARHIERVKNLSTTKTAKMVIEAIVIPYWPRRTKFATPGIDTSTAWSEGVSLSDLISSFSGVSVEMWRLSWLPYSPILSLLPLFDLERSKKRDYRRSN